jgi:hypothetical protein
VSDSPTLLYLHALHPIFAKNLSIILQSARRSGLLVHSDERLPKLKSWWVA